MFKYRLKVKLQYLAICGIVILFIIFNQSIDIRQTVEASLMWVKSFGKFAPILYIIIYNLATILFIPGSLLTLKGGCLFGWFWGSVYVTIAALLGATCAFMLGRYLCRDWVSQQLEKHPKLKAINQAVNQEGWKIVLLTRLSPIFPFNLINYVFGVTQVSLKDYIVGSLGMIPATVMYVYIGSFAGELATLDMSREASMQETQIIQWSIRIIGLIATIAGTLYINKLAKKAVHESVLGQTIHPIETQEN